MGFCVHDHELGCILLSSVSVNICVNMHAHRYRCRGCEVMHKQRDDVMQVQQRIAGTDSNRSARSSRASSDVAFPK